MLEFQGWHTFCYRFSWLVFTSSFLVLKAPSWVEGARAEQKGKSIKERAEIKLDKLHYVFIDRGKILNLFFRYLRNRSGEIDYEKFQLRGVVGSFSGCYFYGV